MAFQKGNKFGRGAASQRPALRALKMSLAAAGDDDKALRRIMDKVVETAMEGERWAVEFVADRLDGKPKQQIDQSITDTRELESKDVLINRFLELQRIAERMGEKPLVIEADSKDQN